MRLIAGMDEKQLENYVRIHRHSRLIREMFHALREMGYFQSCPDGSGKQSKSSSGCSGSSGTKDEFII
jgi:hypothetical protein